MIEWVKKFWAVWLILGGLIAVPSGIRTLMPAPSPGTEVQTNFRQAAKVLGATGEPSLLLIKAVRYWLKADRLLLYASPSGEQSLIDVIVPALLADVRVAEIASENFYVISYPKEFNGNRVDYRLNLYDLKDGLRTSTIMLNCTAQTYQAPKIELANERFDRAMSMLTFDLQSNCTKIVNSVGEEIEFGPASKVSSRVSVLLDDTLVLTTIFTTSGQKASELEAQMRKDKLEREEICRSGRAVVGRTKFGDSSGWVGDCVQMNSSTSSYIDPAP
jgi:hypothetical protein